MRKKKLLDYYMEFPPTGVDFDNWDKRTTEKYFNWFLQQVPIRIDYLKTHMTGDLGIDAKTLDYSPNSLILVWRWFLNVAVVEKTPKKFIREMKRTDMYKLLGDSFINHTQLSLQTELILRDVGMYLAQTLIANCPGLRWSYKHDAPSSPIKDIYNNKPLLMGFEENGYTIDFEPIHMVGVQAAKLLDNCAAETDLFNLYNLYANRLTNDSK